MDEQNSFKTLFVKILLPGLISGLLHALSFPNVLWGYGFGLISLFALIPVFHAAFSLNSKKEAFLSGLAYGLIAYVLTVSFYFGNCFTGLYFALVIWNGIFYGLMCVLFNHAYKKNPKTAPFVVAIVLVAYQYLFISKWWLGTYVGFLPYSLYSFPVFTQILDIAGVHGIMFILALVQASVASLLISPSKKSLKNPAVITSAALIIFQILYGIVCLDYWKNKTPDTVLNLGVVQPNCGDYDTDYGTDKGYERLKNQILSVSAEKPDLIVTSETAFTYFLSWYSEHPLDSSILSYFGPEEYYRMLQNQNKGKELFSVSQKIGIPMIVGHPDLVLSNGLSAYPEGYLDNLQVNRMSLIENGEVVDFYDKVHLAPVVETLPLNNTETFSNLYKKAGLFLFKQGESADPIVFSGLEIGTPVCFEGHFPYLCSSFNADLFISSGSNSYDRVGWGQLHDAMISSFRAIENRRTYVRIFNTGLSCVFTPWGEMTERLEANEMTEAVWKIEVFNDKRTLYSLDPDFLGRTASIITILYILTVLFSNKRRRKK